MIQILSLAQRNVHGPVFDRMFEDRKRLFVDLLGWDVPVIDNRFEIDRFDTEHAIYFVATVEDEQHHGSLRLLPTARPHVLDSLFGDLCPGGVPTGEHIYEITRLCLPARLGSAQRLETRKQLISAMVDYALANGIAQLTGVVDAGFRKDILNMGWLAEPLGPAKLFDGANLGAFAIHISSDTPERLNWTGIYRENITADRAQKVSA